MGQPLPLDAGRAAALSAMADGDGRYLLNLAEELFDARPAEAARHRGAGRAVQRSARRSTTSAARTTTT